MRTSTKPMFVGLMLFVALTASAGGFKLKTAKPVGQTLSVAINAGLPLTHWTAAGHHHQGCLADGEYREGYHVALSG